jgi:hypothetical protein
MDRHSGVVVLLAVVALVLFLHWLAGPPPSCGSEDQCADLHESKMER